MTYATQQSLRKEPQAARAESTPLPPTRDASSIPRTDWQWFRDSVERFADLFAERQAAEEHDIAMALARLAAGRALIPLPADEAEAIRVRRLCSAMPASTLWDATPIVPSSLAIDLVADLLPPELVGDVLSVDDLAEVVRDRLGDPAPWSTDAGSTTVHLGFVADIGPETRFDRR
jgi:hypothetical protein